LLGSGFLREVIKGWYVASRPDETPGDSLGHVVLVYIHPYIYSNGRMGQFVVNVMLAAGGYPWPIIPVERRDDRHPAGRCPGGRASGGPFLTVLE
jgi:hypothetical protein